MIDTAAQLLAAEMEREEREANQALLLKSHVEDLRQQLQAAVDLLCERSGMTRIETNQALAERIARNRGTSCDTSASS